MSLSAPRLVAQGLLAALTVAAAGPDASSARPLGTTLGGFLTDQRRFVVTQPGPGDFRISDLASGETKTLALPCRATAMGLGSPALLACVSDDQTRTYSELVFPATGEHRPVSATDSGGQFNNIGRHWMETTAPCPGVPSGYCNLYENWRTGERRLGGDPNTSPALDLDTPDLAAVKGAYMGADQSVGRWRLRVDFTRYPDRLTLKRAGRTVARQSLISGIPQLTRRAATWASGTTIYVRPLRGRRTFKKRLASAERVLVAQVGGTIVYAEQPDPDKAGTGKVITAVSLAFVRRRWASTGYQ